MEIKCLNLKAIQYQLDRDANVFYPMLMSAKTLQYAR